ncbi:actin [Popillia japonica]|uniref:Actin n=1 Tax=Popillia japonica TaxID=7064 RepID=A0AAW1IYD0_POPJA
MEILTFQDLKTTPDIIHEYTSFLKENNVPIIIDNGSYQCRVGWANSEAPILTFKNLLAKPRKERSKKETVEIPQLQIGNDIVNIEAVRFQLKTQFDRNVVTHFEAQERLFDYTFMHLGIDTENIVPHPIAITEAFLNPNSSRQLMSELLFECYSVPGVSYGIDGLYSYNYSDKPPRQDALIVSMGYHTIHIIPVLDGEIMFSNSRRMNIGGFHVVSFLHRMLQLKYPAHTNAITLSRAEELLHTICLIALDYRVELNKWMDPDYYETNTKRIQLPYTANVCTAGLTVEQQKERKKELARRLIEINARKREERLAEDEEKLQQLLEIQENDWNDYEQEKAFTEYQIKNYEDLQKNIAFLTSRIEKNKRKIAAAMNGEEIVEEPPIKQVKTNKFVFETEKALQTFVQNAKKKRQEILNRKAARKQRKQDMAKRRTAAGQERMRIISQLARKEKGNDDFGLRDEDWDIYKTISRDGADSDSETENEKLLELEEIIRTHEPSEEDDTFGPGEAHQLHIGVERYRAPELIFKPYMIGSSEAGLSEVIGYVLSLFNSDDQLRLASNIVLTGGLANLAGLQERVHSDLISIRPFKSFSAVSVLSNCTLSSWYGAKAWAHTDEFKKTLITRRDYDELGADYLRAHKSSNFYCPTPKEQLLDVDV